MNENVAHDPLLAARPPAAETISIRLMAGTSKRIDKVLNVAQEESRSSFLRKAIDKALREREEEWHAKRGKN